MNEANAIGVRIREARRAQSLSQAELGQKLAVAQTTVSSWEKGRVSVPAEQIPRLSNVLGPKFSQEAESGRAIGTQTMKQPSKIGERIRERRLANALSQSELAEKLHVAQATVSSWEIGRIVPPKDNLPKLDEILGGLNSNSEATTEAESQSPVEAWLSRSLTKKNFTVGELAAKAGVSIATVYNILGGRAQNPHSRTITALEKALGDQFESKHEARQASKIAGIGELIDFNPYDQKEIPTQAGVYVLYDISQRPIYVGKATTISVRLNDHASRFWYKKPLVETGAYIEIKDRVLRDQIETVLIQFLKNNAVINKRKAVRDED